MALFHFHLTQVKRSAGQSAIASVAYRAGEKLYSEYYGEVSDYSRKRGVIHSEIMLPKHAPPEYADRQTLWNAVERTERGRNAQLAYSFDIALQNEFTMEENTALVQKFVAEQLVARGMIADVAIHDPDRGEGGIKNPHFHVLVPIRPLNEDGTWGLKQRRVYRLDEAGNRVLDEDGKPQFDAVPTTNWGTPETLEAWRAAWAELVNTKFAEKGFTCRIDHRSYLRQECGLLPTVHEGPAVRGMELRGVKTDKGDLNRWIRATNDMVREIGKKIAALFDWLDGLRQELDKAQVPNLAELLGAYYKGRNANAYSSRGRAKNLKQYAETVQYLVENKLYSLDDLEARIQAHRENVIARKQAMDAKRTRMKELKDLLESAELYRTQKPVYDDMNAIRWKGRKEKFQNDHAAELRQFYMVRRKLKEAFQEHGELPVTEWQSEYQRLCQEYEEEYAAYKPLRTDLMYLLNVKSCVDAALRQDRNSIRKNDLEKGKERL